VKVSDLKYGHVREIQKSINQQKHRFDDISTALIDEDTNIQDLIESLDTNFQSLLGVIENIEKAQSTFRGRG
jgi:hypothetical protein